MGCADYLFDNRNDTMKIVINAIADTEKCYNDCKDGFFSNVRNLYYKKDTDEWIRYLEKNLPALQYVTRRYIDYLFSNGLTTGSEEKDVELNRRLEQPNMRNDSNISVLKEAIYISMIWGKVGLRAVSEEDGLIYYTKDKYVPFIAWDDKVKAKRLIGYIVSTKQDDQCVTADDLIDCEFDVNTFLKDGRIIDKERELMILSTDEFCELKWYPGDKKGQSPLLKDKQRLTLIMQVFERLNHDLEYDGPGRQIWQPEEGYGMFGNETSTSDSLEQTNTAKQSKVEKVKSKLNEFGEEYKHSKSGDIIFIPPGLKLVAEIPRVTRATEFFDYIDEVGDIICQVYATPSALYELGRVYGNVSMAAIIDNGVLNSVVPRREAYSNQFSPLLARLWGFETVEFDKYELQQVSTDNEERLQVVDMITELQDAGFTEIADMLAEILENDIVIAGELATLAVKDNIDKSSVEKLCKYAIMEGKNSE